jgi:signal transduction histidine kinase
MRVEQQLEIIRDTTIESVDLKLASREEVRHPFDRQLILFFDYLDSAIRIGDYSKMEPILKMWCEAQTESVPFDSAEDLAALLDVILNSILESSRKIHPSEDILDLIGQLLPVFSYSHRYINSLIRLKMVEEADEAKQLIDERLVRLERSKTNFISIAAHELRTPLTIIEGYTSILHEAIQKKAPPDQYDSLLNGIETGSLRLREIINNMIDITMMENGILSLNIQPIWLYQIIGIVSDRIQPVLNDRKQVLEINRFDGDNELNLGDGERLCQVLNNILLNAVKFTPDGGKITIDGRKLPGFVELMVTDSGIGINPEDLMTVFDTFTQVDESALHSSGKVKFKGGGPGLGLSIAKGIIEAHGGSIWVESQGRDEGLCPGSTFHILLPQRNDTHFKIS